MMTMKQAGNKIILAGYRATGKSSIGRELAGRLGLDFVDMDQMLEERFGPVKDIVADKGWPFFREQEARLLEELVDKDNLVLATGGGAVMHEEAWQRLIRTGLAVWLTSDIDKICRRLTDDSVTEGQRPSLTGADVLDEVRKVLAEREPLYKKGSHITVDSNRTISEVADDIETRFRQYRKRGQFLQRTNDE